MKTNLSLISITPKTIMEKQDFKTLNLLGKGTFGEVYKVLYKNQDIYAMKCISKSILIKYGKVQQAQLELEIMYSLNHENVMKLYSHFEDEEHLSLILEYINGSNLYDILKKEGKLQESYAIHYLKQIVDTMIYLHTLPQPILHRDIKPENIMINDLNRIKLADFGSANSLQEGELRFTYTGTALFMAPEILENKGYDQKIDVWSLGVLIYELITGESPFLSRENEMKLDQHSRNKLVNDNIINVRITYPLDFPPLARDLLRKMLKKDPNQRISFKEIAEHPFLKQNIMQNNITQSNTYVSKDQRIAKAINNFNNKPKQANKFKENSEKIIELKCQINELQVQIQKGEIEKVLLSEKLQELQNAQQDDEWSSNSALVSPSKIVKIEDKFNKLNRQILELQKQIVDTGTYIKNNQDKLDRAAYLKKKRQKQQQYIEKLEKDIIELNNIKKIEQQKQNEIIQTFTAINKERHIETDTQTNDNQLKLLKELIEKVKLIIQQHKNYLTNDEYEDETFEDNDNDDQLDERRIQLQRDYEDTKRLLASELQLEMRELRELEEKNSKLKQQLKGIEQKQENIKRADEVLKNLKFAYQIKRDRIQELQTQQDDNQKKIKEMTDQFEHNKSQQQKIMP